MPTQVKKAKAEIATIDCTLITIETADGEFGFDTANQIAVEPQIETQENITLIVKNILRAQKPAQSTITGNQVTLTDNLFNPDLVKILQGGKITLDENNQVVAYSPPVSGSSERGEVFTLHAYTTQYDSAGLVVRYEKISYPNCQGVPMAFGSQDGTFRVPEYTINSAPKSDEPPYTIEYVNQLPVLVDEYQLGGLIVSVEEGEGAGEVKATVTPTKNSFFNRYFYNVGSTSAEFPVYGVNISQNPTWTEWDGTVDIAADTDDWLTIIETNRDGKALGGGSVQVEV